MTNFDNGLIAFELLPEWEAEEDDEGNVVCHDPSELEIWLQIELAGVKGPRQPLDASSFIAECYEDELSSGGACLYTLDNQTALVSRSIELDHEGTPYVLSYFHLAHNQSRANIQIVQFGLAVPKHRSDTTKVHDLLASVERIARTVTLHPWSSEKSGGGKEEGGPTQV